MQLHELDEQTYEQADNVIDIWVAFTNSLGDFDSTDTKELVASILTLATVISRK